MIAVDARVLVELLTDGPRADAVEACLRQSLGSGRVVVCDAALAQVCTLLRNGADALAAQEVRQPVGAGVQLGVGERGAMADRNDEARPDEDVGLAEADLLAL